MNNNRLLGTIIALVVVLGAIGWYLSANGLLPGGKSEKASEYQAVFLTNGQVYFGKLSGQNGRYLTLKDIYYLQLAQSPQPSDNKTAADQQAQISLVKLGNELHGPADEMKINRDHVLFIEDMKENAKVVDAIVRYQKDGPSQTSNQNTTIPAASPSPTK
jgi:hypothetical protein